MAILRIERLGHQGDGIARGPVFVPGALPGEEVEGEVVDGILAVPKIVTPSSDRVRGPCAHARSCGGCQLQHASDGFVGDWKTDVVRQALSAHGLDTELRTIATSPSQTRRRAAFSVRRTKKGALAGFHIKASDVIVAVPNCLLVHPDIAAALPLVEQIGMLGASRKGELSVLITRTDGGLDVAVRGGRPLDAALGEMLAGLGRQHDLARLSWEGDVAVARRQPELRMGKANVVPPPGAFLQATPEGEAALLAAVQEVVAGARRVADLFAGCGTFALPLSGAAPVHAVEGEAPMLAALDHGWRNAQGLKPVTTETRDLFRNPLLVDELRRFDAVVIDPPRAGAQAQIAELAAAHMPRIAYVSCNPVSFARDAAALVAQGYTLDWIQVVDQFRWSTHVELAACLTRTR
ncbi:class I SAM-dependent RNA methyltransferase [Puniceibacterium sp. IMCC21224]|uniref:class I SAM-dependent RNA methyltransferase n=1 Tax=Puniceibacterium sp. IMCC21224 TaxID=1618204 RepID=UPI00064DAC2F|nr:class I SAM-dependent RNA methyltransferase [Puniceibacterium sp. IMCC21224]KMK65439.1 23S rRNA m(5)U-1939 methyltransferase [Puniceibacterium sp. IMCC21224]